MATAAIDNDMAELPVNCQVVETDRNHLNREEHELLKELLRPGALIESIIPENALPTELWHMLATCVRGHRLLEARMLRLRPIIGRILVIFENKPSLYKALGYETYTDFMRRGVYDTLGLHHTSAWEGRLVARDWPQLTPDRYAQIGPKKVAILSKFMTGRSPNADAMLDVAQPMRVREFREYATQRGLISEGECDGATIVITTNRMVAARWKEFASDGRIHSVVGSKDHGQILEAVLQEVSNEWIDKGEQIQQMRRQEIETTAPVGTAASAD